MDKVTFEDIVAEHINRYRLDPVDGQDNVYDIVPIRGTVTQAGTPIRAAELNAMQEFVEEKAQVAEDSAAAATNAQTAVETAAANAMGACNGAQIFAGEAADSATAAAASAAAAANAGTMQLIRQITTTEDLGSVTISADTEGNALSLDRFCLLIQFPAAVTLGQQTGNCVLSVYANGYTANYCLHYQANVERAKYVRLEGEIMGAAGDAPRCLTSMAVGGDNIFGNPLRTGWYGSGFTTLTKLIIGGTLAGSNAAGIPSGTVLTLYGRKA